jgi:hypothetical protein
MALQSSGAISLNEIHVEAGGTSGSQATINDTDIRGLISKASGAQMSFSEWYGASNTQSFTISSNQSNLNLYTYLNTAGWNGTATAIVTINSSVWIYATNTSNYGMTIPSNLANKLELKNYGKIIGAGGAGGNSAAGSNGNHAIYAEASGITITNYSGAYIAGGGGGGGGFYFSTQGWYVGGGGGAGGGDGASSANGVYAGGSGGSIGNAGSGGTQRSAGNDWGRGGGSGGEGGAGGGGGGGGRVLPGTGGTGGLGGDGGSANAGGGSSSSWAGGGGGWAASGGSGGTYGGGTGGYAIYNTQSYTLSNSGTIYGST